jgi:site-specific recombinase XerC
VIAVHFIGSIVYVEQGLSQVSHQAPLLVIDGQQRLTKRSATLPLAWPGTKTKLSEKVHPHALIHAKRKKLCRLIRTER